MTDRSSGRIRQLPPGTVSRIAAGEVAERPASIVKELVENAIDAGARFVAISLTSDAGRITRIAVTDDGTGMNRGDCRLAFARHATSKIRDLPDIATCGTLGFRGEALASIAAVSEVTLVSRERAEGEREGEIAGTRIVVRGGEVVSEQDAGCPAGTSITVQDIFYNTPARKKFQKSLAAETAMIAGVVERIAVTRPGTGFRLTHNGREKIAVPGSGSLSDTIIHLFGLDLFHTLVPVEKTGFSGSVAGFVSVPDISRKNQYQVYLSLNGRSIFSRVLSGAIRDAYGTLLPDDRFPIAFLDVRVPGDEVDVNVHPGKREVRLSREYEIVTLVRQAVQEALATRDLIPVKDGSGIAHPREPYRYAEETVAVADGVNEPLLQARKATERQLRLTETGPGGDRDQVPNVEIIGQLADLYIIARTGAGDLLIVDQHAAHERILYEQLGAELSGEQPAQELIDPVVLHVSAREREMLVPALPLLAGAGFAIEEFGRQDFAVRAVPVALGRNLDPAAVRDTLAELIAPASSREAGRTEHVRRILACRGAIKAGAACTPEQCRQIVSQLRRTENPYTCPHGRPTMIVLPRKKLDELFKRT